MEFFRFCLEIIQKEAAKLNVGINMTTVNQITAANVNDLNYDNGHNRCAFLYRCGTIDLSLAKDCFSKFLLDYNGLEYLMAIWKSSSSLTFCSISKGPALDYIALLLSHEQCRILTSVIRNVKVISRHGAWRNTANIVQEIINNGYFPNIPPPIGNIDVIQGDPINDFTPKVKVPLNESDVVMMIRTLNLQSTGYNQEKISKAIQEILNALKPGAVLFCIDTKPSVKEIMQLLTIFPGTFLLEPVSINTRINLEYTDLYKAHFGCIPVISGRGSFFVWEKSLVSNPKMTYTLNETSQPVKCATITDKVIADESSAEVTCKSPINQKAVTISSNQYLARHFSGCSTPNLDEENSVANMFDHGNKTIQYGPMPLSDDFEKKGLNISCLSSLRKKMDAISNNMSMQTEPEEFLKGTEVNKITELTNKITDLTLEVTKLLEDNTYASDNCCRNSEEMSNQSDPNLDKQNLKECCCYQKCVHKQCCLFSCHNRGNIPACDETSNFCNPSNSASAKFLAENPTQPVPQLVIPLTNLSADTVCQIMSIIAQSNQELQN